MELFASRGYYFCRYCGSFHFPQSAGDDGIRVLGEENEAKACAVCAKPLASALLDESHPVRYCRNCRGVLLARASFATVVHRRRAWATDPPGPAIPLDRAHLERPVSCPVCRRRMETHPYFGPGNVVIDSVIKGDTVREVLKYVEFDSDMLVRKLHDTVEAAVRETRMTIEESGRLLRFYEDGLHGYTYLEDPGER